MLSIVIINQPLYNRGDQSAHKALIGLLQTQPDIEVTVLSLQPQAALEVFAEGIEGVQYITVPPFRKRMQKFFRNVMMLPPVMLTLLDWLPSIRRYNRILRKADYVLCSPGGICMGGYKNWVHIWNLANALALKKRTGIYGRSIGPFYDRKKSDRAFTRRSVDILKRINYLSLRDQQSQETARQLGVPFVPTIDTAFAVTPGATLPEVLSGLRQRRYAVFVPNQLYRWHPDFKTISHEKLDGLYKSIIEALLSRGLDVVMLPQLFAREKVDQPYFEQLASEFDSEKVTVIPDIYNSDIQQKIISLSTLVVGARYHSVVFAINNQVPFVCLSYEHKMLDTLRLLGLETYSLSIGELIKQDDASEAVAALLDRIEASRPAVLEQILQAGSRARAISHQAFEAFISVLREHKK